MNESFSLEDVHGEFRNFRSSYERIILVAGRGALINFLTFSVTLTMKEYLEFLYNARGSLEGTRYYLLLAKGLGYLTLDRYEGIEGNVEKSV